jgi:hypothetical protein
MVRDYFISEEALHIEGRLAVYIIRMDFSKNDIVFPCCEHQSGFLCIELQSFDIGHVIVP